jgi:hypothetical protein
MTGFVYAIGDGERVKIGWSEDPIRRLNKIRSDCPNEAHLLGLISATRMQEAEAHKLLAPWHIRGEWFRHEGAVAAFIDMLPRSGPRRPRPRPYRTEPIHPLRAYRERQDPPINCRQLANLLGVSIAAISHWEAGQRQPGKDIIPHITEKTGISARELRPDIAALMRPSDEA